MATESAVQTQGTDTAVTSYPESMAPLAEADHVTPAIFATLPEAIRAALVAGWTAKLEAFRLKQIQDAPFNMSINKEGNLYLKFQNQLSGTMNGAPACYEAIARNFDAIIVPFLQAHVDEMREKAGEAAKERAIERKFANAGSLSRYLSAR